MVQKKITKKEFVDRVAETLGMPAYKAGPAVDGVFHVVTEALANGESIGIPGFGTFEVRNRAPRYGRNMHTGERIDIPAVKTPFFKPGKNLRDAVR